MRMILALTTGVAIALVAGCVEKLLPCAARRLRRV